MILGGRTTFCYGYQDWQLLIMSLASVLQSLSKEQINALLAAVVPNSAKERVDNSRDESKLVSDDDDDTPDYAISEMFAKKKKNAKASKAQRYLLVSTYVNTPAN